MRKNTIEDCHALAKRRDGKFLSQKYINNKTKYLWQCEAEHQFKMRYDSVYNGQWCPRCGTNKRTEQQKKTIQDCHNLAGKRNGRFLSKEYINSQTKYLWKCSKCKHRFWSKYNDVQQGHWCPLCAKEKRKQTWLEKYGVENLSQNKEIALKAAKSMNNSCILYHWNTGKEIVCVGSYEKKVVNFLNISRANYLWQPRVFRVTNRKTYRPDLFLVDKNLWVEIKGYFRQDAQRKWNWFHWFMPNSELWGKEKLIELGIL